MSSRTPVGHIVHVGASLPDAPRHALSHLPYLGGVLHGALTRYLSGLASGGTSAPSALSWRLHAPPWRAGVVGNGARVQWLSPKGVLHFGVVLHQSGAQRCEEVIAALQRIEWLGSSADRHRVGAVICHVEPLPVPPVPADTASAPPITTIRLSWVTPLRMASDAQIEAGHGREGPSLLRVVRSLARRALQSQPQWADALGIATPAWTIVEENLRQAQALHYRLSPADWQYGSRTKPRPYDVFGLCGEQVFMTPLPAAARAILAWGHWLGVGEGTMFGCGQYGVSFEES